MDYKKVLRGLGIAVAGAVITYLAQVITTINFGVWTPMVVALASAGVNAAREYVKTL